jgi:hypothetical protein
MLSRERKIGGRKERLTVFPGDSGWEVRHERDGRVVKRRTYDDWHRVERALKLFDLRFWLPSTS